MTEPSVVVVLVNEEQQRTQMKVDEEIIDGQHRRAESVFKPLMRNVPRTRIDGVFHQFFQRAGRSFHHFTSGNTVDQIFGKPSY